MPTPEHNPQSIPPSQIPPGWRLCRESEREKLPGDAKLWDAGHWAEFTYITATPLPESEREAPWILRSVREPVDKDFPVFLYADKPGLWSAKTQVRLCHHLSNMAALEFKDATHWQPAAARLPAPPPAPAKTQREKDEEAFERLWAKGERLSDIRARNAAEAICDVILTQERAHFAGRSSEEVAARINEISNMSISYNPSIRDSVCSELRALLSPPKEGEKP